MLVTLPEHMQGMRVCVQVDEEASIRANTTVLLGNLANHLSGAH
jgi:hypothetical protein